ncbi:DNA photolyase [Rhodobacteraceae bacterium HSP-20]|uniref:DNA photolyase n=1 Tax=Paragemmobacter amnigenus TaxID=2852097 RepID=A0ABS6J6X8_9RHOB|nr:FAD-binding domain-containing protein [Rhodobacter amnigenus]MBU9699515.1 DNA photolyase [Rhodobacter amnigenus]MBV4390742.1 DNA photolyase [Rhodobacter amnigenus]
MDSLPLPLPATRAAALARLAAFLPRAGLPYAARRNEDLPGHPHVSGLSPYIRHRLLTEAEVIDATLRTHPQGADKFLAEVWWRTYWKGWLERRPAIWSAYRQGLTAALNRVQTESGLRTQWEAACTGDTGIDGFDHWARELVATGYLHNHARMWFASIWIFTLRLPWELGADFFLRHLIDGDPASNTLSWRWVGGLHTQGKTYAATTDNIAKNTGGRFRPAGLARDCAALPMTPHPAPRPVPQGDIPDPTLPSALLLHEDDLSGDGFASLSAIRQDGPLLFLATTPRRSPLAIGTQVADFVTAALDDTARRLGQPDAPRFTDATPDALADHLAAQGIRQLVTPYAPIGPTAAALQRLAPLLQDRDIRLTRLLRDHDAQAWPHATHGFFRFREGVM